MERRQLVGLRSQMQSRYDKLILGINHYCLYHEQLPFIGGLFDKYKILIIGESHFISSKIKTQINDDFYTNRSILEKFYSKDYICDIDTRKEATKNNRHQIHRQIYSALKSLDLNYENIAFYNYFQKPALSGRSLKPTEYDKTVAYQVLNDIVNILSPTIVIFTSKKAFKSFEAKNVNNFKANYTCHPTCKWWTISSNVYKKGGKQKMIELINEIIR